MKNIPKAFTLAIVGIIVAVLALTFLPPLHHNFGAVMVTTVATSTSEIPSDYTSVDSGTVKEFSFVEPNTYVLSVENNRSYNTEQVTVSKETFESVKKGDVCFIVTTAIQKNNDYSSRLRHMTKDRAWKFLIVIAGFAILCLAVLWIIDFKDNMNRNKSYDDEDLY